MKRFQSKSILITSLCVSLVITSHTAIAHGDAPKGYWTLEQAQEILDKTRQVTLNTSLDGLTDGEKAAVDKLIQAGRILHDLYEDSLHPQAWSARDAINLLHDASHRQALKDLYYMFRGPIAITLNNQKVPFLPVKAQEPGKNVYPWGITSDELNTLMDARPELRATLLDDRSVVRESTAENLQTDLTKLDQFPVLDDLHHGLRASLEALTSGEDDAPWYALPYSVRWAHQIMAVYSLLNQAADNVQADDNDYAAYLRQRARDLLSDNYEGGDATWVRGDFKHLNGQIGSYESYDDALYGVKSFFSLSVLMRDAEKSDELAAAISNIQQIQDGLPQKSRRQVQSFIPVGVYNVVADFGQSRSANTATILPNEADHARKYGRTIMLRYNIMTHPDLFADTQALYQAAVLPEHGDDLTLNGGFYRTLWHEIGHYLGVDKTTDGRDLGAALSPWGDLLEEMKSDLVSLNTAPYLEETGVIDATTLRSMYASGVRRVLKRNKPRREQPYQTMQLMQMNYYLEKGLLRFDESSGRLGIDYDRYPAVVHDLLEKVLDIQASGDPKKALAFIDQYTTWGEDLHERLAARLRDASTYRFRTVRYQALQ